MPNRKACRRTLGINPKITRPIAALNILITTKLAKAPANTVIRECLVAMMAAIRKVLSPISETTIITKAWTKPSGANVIYEQFRFRTTYRMCFLNLVFQPFLRVMYKDECRWTRYLLWSNNGGKKKKNKYVRIAPTRERRACKSNRERGQ